MATRSSGSSRNALNVSPMRRLVARSMALALGRSSVTSMIPLSRRILIGSLTSLLPLPPPFAAWFGSARRALPHPAPLGPTPSGLTSSSSSLLRCSAAKRAMARIASTAASTSAASRPRWPSRSGAQRSFANASRTSPSVTGSSRVTLSASNSTSVPPEPIVSISPSCGSRLKPTSNSTTISGVNRSTSTASPRHSSSRVASRISRGSRNASPDRPPLGLVRDAKHL